MAISVTNAGRIRVLLSIQQNTLVAVEAILAGSPVREDTAGKWTNANGSIASEALAEGIALRTVAANEPLTVLRKGVVDGFTFSTEAYGSEVFLGNTDALLQGTAGTVSKKVGNVIAGTSVLLGTANDKLLSVDM